MNLTEPNVITRLKYAEAAEAYLRSLPMEHFMEAITQSTQRKITLESLDLVHAARPEVQIFSELLVQYPRGADKLGQVVPDNMVVIHPEPVKADGSYDLIFEPAHPFLVLEYVSKHTKRKDYDDNMVRYEQDLKVPYYLLFCPDSMDLSVFHLKRRKYVSVQPNAEGRLAIPELELEVALLDDWVRFWFRGELLPLPADLQRELTATRLELQATQGQLQIAQGQLHTTQGQLHTTQGQLQSTQGQLQSTQGQLHSAQGQLQSTQGQLQIAQGQLHDTARRAETAEAELARLRAELEQARRPRPES